MDGKDIRKALLAGQSARKGEMIFALRGRNGYSDVGARRDQWKLCRVGQGPWMLFNIAQDISEKHDLSKQYPELLQAMVEEVAKWGSSHTEPQWFYVREEGEHWKADGMPHFKETFSLSRNHPWID